MDGGELHPSMFHCKLLERFCTVLMLELLTVSVALGSYGRQTVFSLAVVVSLQPSKEKMHFIFF